MAGVCTRGKSKRQQRFATAHTDLSASLFLRNSLLNVVAKPALNKILWQIEVSLQERSKARRNAETVEVTARGRGGDGIPCVLSTLCRSTCTTVLKSCSTRNNSPWIAKKRRKMERRKTRTATGVPTPIIKGYCLQLSFCCYISHFLYFNPCCRQRGAREMTTGALCSNLDLPE